uniref:Rad50/SbcC-type AAA domain-containing protein n=1 Tax=Glossina morsitans morsitans TaxID=37546 RepID=A0A1B0FCJ7_GLOMM
MTVLILLLVEMSHASVKSLSLSKKRKIRENPIQNVNAGSSVKRSRNTTQSQSERTNISGIEDTRRCGKIISIHLTNFMCHSNLRIEFNSRVNFLVGRNGSGKSAILAALVLGLGCNAKVTNRSKSAKDFIKIGETTAKIEITIANDGPQPFDPDEYGDSITIVRTITTSSGYYAIRNSQGRIISKKFDDLQRILLYHNIQADNPVFVLNQDSAREFLKELEPSKNYQLFLKATQIDLITEKLDECLHLHKAHREELANTEKKLQYMEMDIAVHKGKLKELIAFEHLGDNLKALNIEYHWLLVKQQEDKLEEIHKKLDKYEGKVNELNKLIHNKDEVNSILTQKIAEFFENIKVKNKDYSDVNQSLRKIRCQIDEMIKKRSEIEMKIESLKKKKSRLETHINELKQHIKERSKSNQDDVDALRRQNEESLANYRKQCETSLMPLIESLKRELNTLMENKSQKEVIIDKIKQEHGSCSHKISTINNQIATAKESIKNKMLIYGRHMPELLKEIKKAHADGKFSVTPVGPIGAYLQVPNNQYRDDCRIFEEILDKLSKGNNHMIVTTKFMRQVYDVSNGRVLPPSGTSLLMELIECRNPVVMNFLIDRMHIETILLTDKKNIAESITSIRENVPHNLSKIVVLCSDSIHLEYYPVPHYRTYSNKIRRPKYLHINVNERVKHLEVEKSKLENQLSSLKKDLELLGPQLCKDKEQIQNKRALLEEKEGALMEIQQKIADLENVEYADCNNELQLLINEIEERDSLLTEIDQGVNEKDLELNKLKSQEEALKDDYGREKNKLQEIQNEIEGMKAELDKLNLKLLSINDNEALNKDRLKSLTEQCNQFEEKKNKIIELINAAKQSAEEKGERLISNITVDEVLTQMARIKAKLQRGRPIDLDQDSLQDLITHKERELETKRLIYDNLKISIDSLRASLRHRFDFIKKFKGHMSMLLTMSFEMILRLRNYVGNLVPDHQNKTLKISVIPRDHDTASVSSARALSGGERSYSTVAFLISLWSCVDHPFYFLDEYDVFTDEVNREYMTRLLTEEGRNHAWRQYAFLTPQDMSLDPENFIRIHRLAEPDRH